MAYNNNYDDNDGGALIFYLGILIVALVILYYSILFTLALGALFGGGTAIFNYGTALVHNVKPRPAINGGDNE